MRVCWTLLVDSKFQQRVTVFQLTNLQIQKIMQKDAKNVSNFNLRLASVNVIYADKFMYIRIFLCAD